MRCNPLLQCSPIPAAALGHTAPQIELELALTRWRARVRLVRPLLCSEFTRRLASSVVDRFKNVLVQPLRRLTLEGQLHEKEGVSESLDSQPDRSVSHV